jgi:hypothetical protein
VTDASPVYPAWGQVRVPGIIFFQPHGRICFTDNVGARQYGILRHSNPSGIPDSLRLHLGKLQLCYAFGVPSGCSPRDGAYLDNISLALVDGTPTALSVDIWHGSRTAFPANETPGYPGNAAAVRHHVRLCQDRSQHRAGHQRPEPLHGGGRLSGRCLGQNVVRVDMVFACFRVRATTSRSATESADSCEGPEHPATGDAGAMVRGGTSTAPTRRVRDTERHDPCTPRQRGWDANVG